MMLTIKRNGKPIIQIGIWWVVFAVVLIFKLTGVLNWSWLWVTAFLWVPLCLGVTCHVISWALGKIASKM